MGGMGGMGGMGEMGMRGSMIPLPSQGGVVMARRPLLHSSAPFDRLRACLMLPSTSARSASSAAVGWGAAHESHSSHAAQAGHAMNGRYGSNLWWLVSHF